MSGSDRIDLLRAAAADLAASRLDRVIERLTPEPEHGGLVGEAILEAAHALREEAAGDMDTAVLRMERASALDAGIPEVLDVAAMFFLRSGRAVAAMRAHLARDIVRPADPPLLGEIADAGQVARYAPFLLRTIIRERRKLTYRAAGLKAALVSRLGAAGATLVIAGMDDGEVVRSPAVVPLVSLYEHARAHGSDMREEVSAGRVASRPPPVFGEPLEAETEKDVRSFFTCVLDDVVVSSKSNVLLADGVALLDVQGAELDRDPDLAVDPIVVTRDGDRVYVTGPADAAALPQVPEAVWLTGVHSKGFGHWLIEFLPKIWALMDRTGFSDTAVLVDEDMPAQHLEALRLFIGDRQRVIQLRPQAAIFVDRLWVASQITYLAAGPSRSRSPSGRSRALDREHYGRLIVRAVKVSGRRLDGHEAQMPASDLARLVYLTRKPGTHRRLVNAAAVEERVVAAGFVAVDFEELSFVEQVRLIRGADHVIGQDGSSMFMTLLGRPGLRILGLAQPRLEEWEWYTDACIALRQDLAVIPGRVVREHDAYDWMSDYEIDLDAIDRYLAASI